MFSGKKEMKIGEALKEVLHDHGLDQKIEETRLLEEWEQMMGQHINKHTLSKRISKSILYIKLDSAALRHELSYSRDKLKQALNKSIGKEIIIDIVFS